MAELLKTAEVAELLRVNPMTVERWRTVNRGPAFVRVRRKVRYRRADVERWLADNLVETKEGAASR